MDLKLKLTQAPREWNRVRRATGKRWWSERTGDPIQSGLYGFDVLPTASILRVFLLLDELGAAVDEIEVHDGCRERSPGRGRLGG